MIRRKLAITEEERREEEKAIERRLMERGVTPDIEYGIEWRKIAPPKVRKPEKGEKFPLLQEEIKDLLKGSLERKIDKLYEKKAKVDELEAKLKEAKAELEEAEKDFTKVQDLKLDQIWLAVGEITGDVENVLNVAYQWKRHAEVLIAFRTELESEEFEKLLTKDGETILRVGKELGIITDEMIKKIEKAIDETNKGILEGIDRFVKRMKITLWPAAKGDRPKLSSFNKIGDIVETLKNVWNSLVEMAKGVLEKLFGIRRETKELAEKALDLSYELEEVGEVYRKANKKVGWVLKEQVDYDIGDIVCWKGMEKHPKFREWYCGEVVNFDIDMKGYINTVLVKNLKGKLEKWNPLEIELATFGVKGGKRIFEEKFGVKVKVLADNVAIVNDEIVVEKTAEDLTWKLFDVLTEKCGCEKKAIEYIDSVVNEYLEKLEKESSVKRGAGWKKLPKGWTMESVRKFWNSLTGDVKHKVTKCIKIMEDKMDDPEAFCASIRDMVEGTTYWRGKD